MSVLNSVKQLSQRIKQASSLIFFLFPRYKEAIHSLVLHSSGFGIETIINCKPYHLFLVLAAEVHALQIWQIFLLWAALWRKESAFHHRVMKRQIKQLPNQSFHETGFAIYRGEQ